MQSDIQQTLEQIKTAWDSLSNVPDDVTTWGFPNLGKQIIGDTIGGMAEMAALLAANDSYQPTPISIANLQQNLIKLKTYVTQHVPGNPQAHIPGLLTLIEQCEATIRGWLIEADHSGDLAAHAFTGRLAEAVSRMKDSEKIYSFLVASDEELKKFVSQAKLDIESIGNTKTSVTGLHTEIETSSSAVAKLMTQANTDSTQISTLVSDFTSLKAELEANRQEQKELFAKFEANKQRVDDLLGDASRTGLAASFKKRKDELLLPLAIWGLAFVISIWLLYSVGAELVLPSLRDADWTQALIRMPLTAPFIWAGWFAARQYGYTIRLREDYAFKEAAALSFEGYKREMGETYPQMKERLLDISVKNFGENPLRIYEGKNNHGSPIHEILERSLKDERLVALLKAIFAKIKA